MFSNSYQSGFVSIFYSVGSNPLALWDKQVKNGHIRRVIDDEIKSLVLEISGTNVATTYITCPIKPRASLGVKLPFFVMVVKNMKKYFTFEIQVLDDKDMHRRFRVSNFQSTTKVRPFCTTMPIGLTGGWNQVQFNLADFTKRAYGSTYMETMRVQIHANVRIRRIYFSDTLYSDEDMPNEFKLFASSSKRKSEVRPSKDQLKADEKSEKIPPPPTPTENEQLALKLPEDNEPAAGTPTPTEKPTDEPEDAKPPAEEDKDITKEGTEPQPVPKGEGEPGELKEGDEPPAEAVSTEVEPVPAEGEQIEVQIETTITVGITEDEKAPAAEGEVAETPEGTEERPEGEAVATVETPATEDGATTEAPATTEEPVTIEEPTTTEEPPTTEEPATTDEPATTEVEVPTGEESAPTEAPTEPESETVE